MKRKRKFIQTLQMWGILFLFCIGGSIVVVDVIKSFVDFNHEAALMRAEYTANQKQMIKQEVNRVAKMIRYEKTQSESRTKKEIVARVYEACGVVRHIYDTNVHNKTDVQLKQMIKDSVSGMRFEQGAGYYFISRLDGTAVLFPSNPELEGEKLFGIRDTHGRQLQRDLTDIVRQLGEGFYQYHWTKPDAPGDDHKKISFVKDLEVYDWFIGSGLYVDDFEERTKTELLSTISRIRFGKEGYIFVNRWNGDALVSNGRQFSGTQKLWEVFNQKPSDMKAIFQKEYDAAQKPDGDYIYYSHVKLSDSSKVSPKASFILGIPDWQWLIGAGVYLDDVDTVIAQMYEALSRQIRTKVLYSIAISVGLISILLLVFSRLNRHLKKDFNVFISFFNRAAASHEPIDVEGLRFEELEQMAENANRMLEERRQAEVALKSSEERYSAIFQEARDGIVLIDAKNGHVVDCNPRFTKIVGKTVAELQQMNVWESIFSNSGVEESAPLLKIDETDIGCTVEQEIVRNDGTSVPIELVSKQIHFRNSPHILSVVRDITARKRTEEMLQTVEKLKSVGTLAGGIAHDFNNILTGLFGKIEIAKSTLSTEHPGFAALDDAENTLQRAGRLTTQLLTFAKGGAPILENVPLNTLIEDVIHFDLSGSNVKAIFDFADDLWPAEADKGQIQQVFSNLTVNARQAMPNGGTLNVSMSNFALEDSESSKLPSGKYVRIVVKDNGPGMNRAQLDRIFEPYYTTKESGTGLGLATTHSIVHKHGGTIRVDSTLGEGTRFTLLLPASNSVPSPERISVAPANSADDHTLRILVMDDEEMIRSLVSDILEQNGYQVETAVEGREAVEMYQNAMEVKDPFDLVIMDLTIPGGLGGKEAVQDILKLDPDAKVLVSSGYSADPIMANYAAYGFSGVVAKPYTSKKLLATIQKVER